MNTSQTLGQNLSQQQRLSPQLQQSLNILQAPVAELRQMIGQEMAQNPVLEMEDGDLTRENDSPEAELEDDDFAGEFEKLSQMEEEWRTWQQQSNAGHGPRTSEEEERRQFLFDSLAAPVTLQDHLMQQLAMAECTLEVRKCVELLNSPSGPGKKPRSSRLPMSNSTHLRTSGVHSAIASCCMR